jgi:flagellar assembly factor FliW
MNAIQESYSVEGTRFGSVSYREEDILAFPTGVIGFPDLNRFILIANSDNGVFSWLQSLDDPEVAFLVTDPCRFAKDYHPFGDNPTGALLTTVNIPQGKPEEMTLNLAGPIVIENGSRRGYQVVLENEAYTTKYRVFAKATQETGEFAA